MAEHWAIAYVGRSYDKAGFDCAHLVELVLREQFGRQVRLPTDRPESNRARDMSTQIRCRLEEFAQISTNPAEGDGVLMIGAGYINHIGVYCLISGRPYVLHNFINARQVCLHSWSELESWGMCVEGIYRWK